MNPAPPAEQSAKARIVNPQDSAVLAYDSHLPALESAALSRAAITTAMARWHSVPAATTGDGNRFAGRSLRDAAVLIGLIQRGDNTHVVFTQRASHLRDHAGQIAFPGGAVDASDADSWNTAQREAYEEIGLASSAIERLGRCHNYTTVTAFTVTPWVAWIAPDAVFTPHAGEVEQVFELLLTDLMNPAHHQRRSVMTPVGERQFYAIPLTDTHGAPRFVWGATAGMVRNLYHTLRGDIGTNPATKT
jgi:8-oxo-dGTP pyrophosphatase MutT (NUDIX family)